MTTQQAKAKLRRKYGWHFTARASKQGDLYAYRNEVDDFGTDYYYYIDVEHYPYRDSYNISIGCDTNKGNAGLVLTFEEYELFHILINEVKKNRDNLLAYWKEKEEKI